MNSFAIAKSFDWEINYKKYIAKMLQKTELILEKCCSLKINVPVYPVENAPTYPDHTLWWNVCYRNRGSLLINIIHNRTESQHNKVSKKV